MSTVNESLISAHDCAEFSRDALMQAHAKASAVESLALYTLIAAAADLANKIKALQNARTSDAGWTP